MGGGVVQLVLEGREWTMVGVQETHLSSICPQAILHLSSQPLSKQWLVLGTLRPGALCG